MGNEVLLNSELLLNYYEAMTKSLKQVQSSELSRNAANDFGQAEQGPILVTRRDGVNLVLMSESTHQDREDFAELVNRVVSASLGKENEIESRPADQFPWMLALSSDGQTRFSNELLAAVRISLATGEPHLALSTFESWKETATAITAGLTIADDWFDDPSGLRGHSSHNHRTTLLLAKPEPSNQPEPKQQRDRAWQVAG